MLANIYRRLSDRCVSLESTASQHVEDRDSLGTGGVPLPTSVIAARSLELRHFVVISALRMRSVQPPISSLDDDVSA
jgi:hypothetical protein